MKLCEIKTQIDPEYLNWELSDWIGDDAITNPIKEIITSYVNNLADNEKNGAGLILHGNAAGTGKTQVAWYVMSKVKEIRNRWARDIQQFAPGYTDIVKISCKDYLFYSTSFEYIPQIQQLKTASFLLLDEVSPIAFSNLEKGRSDLWSLIDYRISSNLPTIYTSNCETDEAFKNLLGPTVFSRIGFKNTFVAFSGLDVRPKITKKLAEEMK